ncbi:MAG: hypothetical protein IK125_02235 [Lachnospiraceae bacterium]|nr:hypothetical protein [Lachnospiraceae bacterium]
MKKRRSLFKGMVMLAMTLIVVWTSVSYVQADLGCHPDYKISLENVPAGYYCAIITNAKGDSRGATLPHDFWEDREIRNSELRLKQVDRETVEEYLSNFYYEGWFYFPNTLLYNSRGPWNFDTHKYPFPGRILTISPEGEVIMSETMEYGQNYTYDVQKGQFVNLGTLGFLGSLLKYVLICYILTLLIEYAVLGSFAFVRVPANRKKFLLVNTVTNIPLNLILYSVYSSGIDQRNWFIMFYVLEVTIMIAESAYYAKNLVDREGKKRPKTAILYGVLANFCSAIVGIAFSLFDLQPW